MALFIPPTASPSPGGLAEWIRKVATAINELSRRLGTFGSTASHSSNFTVTDTDYLLMVDASGGGVTVYLPASQVGRQMVVKKVDASSNNVTIDASGSDTIDGAGSKAISTQWQSYTIMGVAGGWAII